MARTLTIKRNKSFAGFLGKMLVYVADAAANELTIKGAACRKLGELKNGEEKSFSIDTAATTVYMIGSESTKDFCVDSMPIPEGTADVRLTGKVTLDPQNGNPFVFDK